LGIRYVLLELLVKLVEVGDEVSGTSRSEVALGVNSDVWVVALVGIEGCVIPVVTLGTLLYANSARG